MKYFLACTYIDDDRAGIFSYTLSNFEGVIHSGQFIAAGRIKNDKTYVGQIATRRMLSEVAKKTEGVASLTIKMDDVLIEHVGYGLIDGVANPVYPSLTEMTKRALRRFDRYELGQITKEIDGELSSDEATAMENAEETLDYLKKILGRLELLKWRLVSPTKIIRGKL